MPSQVEVVDTRPPAEQAASAELGRIEAAVARNGKIPRWRYERIVTTYPGTPTAYRVNLMLALQDHAALKAQRASSASRRNIEPAFRQYVETYAFGSHAQPSDPQLAEEYRQQVHPLLHDVLQWLGDLSLQFRYIERFPNESGSVQLRQAIERALIDPQLRWQAIERFEAYARLQPPSPNLPAIRDRIEVNLVHYVDTFGTRKDCDIFLERFPQSPHRSTIETLRKEKLI